MDRSSLAVVLLAIHDIKESLFSLQGKIQNSNKLSKEDKENFLERIHKLVDKVNQIENSLYQVKDSMDLWVIVDRALWGFNELIIMLGGERDVNDIWDMQNEVLSVEKELYIKGVE